MGGGKSWPTATALARSSSSRAGLPARLTIRSSSGPWPRTVRRSGPGSSRRWRRVGLAASRWPSRSRSHHMNVWPPSIVRAMERYYRPAGVGHGIHLYRHRNGAAGFRTVIMGAARLGEVLAMPLEASELDEDESRAWRNNRPRGFGLSLPAGRPWTVRARHVVSSSPRACVSRGRCGRGRTGGRGCRRGRRRPWRSSSRGRPGTSRPACPACRRCRRAGRARWRGATRR